MRKLLVKLTRIVRNRICFRLILISVSPNYFPMPFTEIKKHTFFLFRILFLNISCTSLINLIIKVDKYFCWYYQGGQILLLIYSKTPSFDDNVPCDRSKDDVVISILYPLEPNFKWHFSDKWNRFDKLDLLRVHLKKRFPYISPSKRVCLPIWVKAWSEHNHFW